MKNIAIFASGSGTNAEAIMDFFEQKSSAGRVVLLISNRSDAYALTRAQNHNVPTAVFKRSDFYEDPTPILDMLKQHNVDFIVLAGFMLLFPADIVSAFPNRIVNIHPALLPAYGGKGMYGDNVHKAVIAAGEKFSGITIHLVDNQYDRGHIVFQTSVEVTSVDTAETLAAKIHKLEHQYFPTVIESQL